MKLTEIYVSGTLEHIGQEKGQIAVRMLCNRKVKVYDNKKERETSSKTMFADEFTKQELTLSHQIGYFIEGDKVKLSRLIGKNNEEDDDDNHFTLKNLTLSKANVCGLDALQPETPMKDLFAVEVTGILEHFTTERGKVALRIKCSEKCFTFFKDGNPNNMQEKTEAFEKTIIGIIPRDNLRLDLCIETLALYKKGDRIKLSRTVEEGDVYDFDNLTLAIGYNNPKYKAKWSL